MAHTPKVLYEWDFIDVAWVPDGYNMREIPKPSLDNFNKLLEEFNNLVEYLQENGVIPEFEEIK